MKAIKDGKVYDTATARKVVICCNGFGVEHVDYLSETLYKTRSGAYFLHGKGGARTHYAYHSGNASSCVEKIWPLSPDEAYRWLEARGFTAEKEAEFPELLQEA